MFKEKLRTGCVVYLVSKRSLIIRLLFSRSFSPSAVVRDDELPYHIVVGMPALSPTMETGILAEWFLGQGDEFSAGQAIAKIETDKASIDFEAQDDGFIAKIILDAGGDDIPVGTPIMVTVEEAEDVNAFADFVVESAPAAAAEPEPTPEPTPEPVVAEAPAKVEAATPPPAAPTPAAPAPVAAPPAMEELAAAVAPVMSTGWGDFAKINSPIAKTLSKQQNDYVEKYGNTGQIPL